MLRTNFFKTILASMLVVCLAGFYSCSSDDEPDGPDGPTGTEADIIGKWEVKNSGGEYGSFEFTGDKKYIVTQRMTGNVSAQMKSNNMITRAGATEYIIIIFGDYSAVSAKDNIYTLNLKEFGTITIEITSSGAEITVNGETYNTSKAKEVQTTDNTKLLCHTWNYKSEDTTNDEIISIGTITFTSAGTYILHEIFNEYGEDCDETSYGTWEFKDSKTISISWTSYYVEASGNGSEPKYWTETEYDDWIITKLTDKELVFEFDEEDYIVTITGTR